MTDVTTRHLCPTCGKVFATRYNLTRHLAVHTGVRLFGCPHCPHRDVTRAQLRRHLSTHTDKCFGCPSCSKRYGDARRFVVHLRGHLGLARHPCLLCERAFDKTTDLNRHRAQNHEPATCSVCGVTVPSAPRRARHEATHPTGAVRWTGARNAGWDRSALVPDYAQVARFVVGCPDEPREYRTEVPWSSGTLRALLPHVGQSVVERAYLQTKLNAVSADDAVLFFQALPAAVRLRGVNLGELTLGDAWAALVDVLPCTRICHVYLASGSASGSDVPHAVIGAVDMALRLNQAALGPGVSDADAAFWSEMMTLPQRNAYCR